MARLDNIEYQIAAEAPTFLCAGRVLTNRAVTIDLARVVAFSQRCREYDDDDDDDGDKMPKTLFRCYFGGPDYVDFEVVAADGGELRLRERDTFFASFMDAWLGLRGI